MYKFPHFHFHISPFITCTFTCTPHGRIPLFFLHKLTLYFEINTRELCTIMVIFNLLHTPFIDCLEDSSSSSSGNGVIVLLIFAHLIKSSFGTILIISSFYVLLPQSNFLIFWVCLLSLWDTPLSISILSLKLCSLTCSLAASLELTDSKSQCYLVSRFVFFVNSLSRPEYILNNFLTKAAARINFLNDHISAILV